MYKQTKGGKPSNTQRMIAMAVFELLKEKEYGEISVSEICDRAQVARKTFYNNFDEKNDIINLAVDEFFDNWEALNMLSSGSVKDIYRSAFEFVDANRDLFMLLYCRGLFSLAEQKLVQYAANRWPSGNVEFPVRSEYSTYYISAMIAAFVSILKTWMQGGFVESVDTMVALTDTLIISKRR